MPERPGSPAERPVPWLAAAQSAVLRLEALDGEGARHAPGARRPRASSRHAFPPAGAEVKWAIRTRPEAKVST